MLEGKTFRIYDFEGGLMFEGNIEYFKNCFFDNASTETITNWTNELGWTVEIIDDT